MKEKTLNREFLSNFLCEVFTFTDPVDMIVL